MSTQVQPLKQILTSGQTYAHLVTVVASVAIAWATLRSDVSQNRDRLIKLEASEPEKTRWIVEQHGLMLQSQQAMVQQMNAAVNKIENTIGIINTKLDVQGGMLAELVKRDPKHPPPPPP